MLQALPVIDWLPEAVEPAVNLVLKRLSKILDKLIQKPDLVVSIQTSNEEALTTVAIATEMFGIT
jgi:hypothetical protein